MSCNLCLIFSNKIVNARVIQPGVNTYSKPLTNTFRRWANRNQYKRNLEIIEANVNNLLGLLRLIKDEVSLKAKFKEYSAIV
jgi:hypothetical protein